MLIRHHVVTFCLLPIRLPSTLLTLNKNVERQILYLMHYLKKTHLLGLKFVPDQSQGFKCYCDAAFSGNWNRESAQVDPSTSKSRSCWVVFCTKCPIIWTSKLQSQVALSTREVEYFGMSMALRDISPILELLDEMQTRHFSGHLHISHSILQGS